MKRLLFLTHEYPPLSGGVANHMQQVMDALRPYVHVQLLVPKALAQQISLVDVRTFSGKFDNRFGWLRALRPCLDTVQTEAVDMVAVSHLLPWGTVAALVGLVTHKPYIVFVHGLDIARAEQESLKRVLAGWILSRAAGVVANSEYTLSRAKALAPRCKGLVVYPSPARTPHTALPNPFQKPFVLAAGRMVQRKGFRTLVRVMEIVRRTIPDAHLVCAGDGPEKEELIADIRDLGLAEYITVQQATNTELDALYTHCRFFLLPIRSSEADPEGFGMVFLEAAAFGKAVVAGGGGGVGEAVEDGVTGILVDPQDPNRIVEAFVRLWQQPEVAERMGRAGQARVAEHFTPGKTVLPLRAFLERL